MLKKTKADINMSRTREALKRIVLDRVEVEITDEMIDSGQQFKEVGVDSLDSIEVLVVMEDELDIELSDERLEKVTNMKELVEYLAEFD